MALNGRLKLGHLRARGTKRPCYPVHVWESTRGDRFDFSFDIVFDPADCWRAVIKEQVRGAGIAVKGLADTPCVDRCQPSQVPHKRLVNVAVDGDRLTEGQIGRFGFRIGCVCKRRAPRTCRAGVRPFKSTALLCMFRWGFPLATLQLVSNLHTHGRCVLLDRDDFRQIACAPGAGHWHCQLGRDGIRQLDDQV